MIVNVKNKKDLDFNSLTSLYINNTEYPLTDKEWVVLVKSLLFYRPDLELDIFEDNAKDKIISNLEDLLEEKCSEINQLENELDNLRYTLDEYTCMEIEQNGW